MTKYGSSSTLRFISHSHIYSEGTCTISKIIHFIKEKFKEGGFKLHPLPLRYQQITKRFAYTSIDAEKIIADGQVKLLRSDSKYELVNRLIQIGEANFGNWFGESGNFLLNVSEEDVNPSIYVLYPERQFISDRQWFGIDGNWYNNVSIVAKGRVDLIGLSKYDFHTYASNKTWQVG
jgi:hypothetical protein